MVLPTAIPIDQVATAVTAVVSASSMTHTQAHAAEVKIGSDTVMNVHITTWLVVAALHRNATI